MGDLLEALVYDREALPKLGRQELLLRIREEIAAYQEMEQVHGGSVEAGCGLYHEVLSILIKVEDAGLDWRELGRDRDDLMARGRRYVLPFLDCFLENVRRQLTAQPALDRSIMRKAFAGRLQRELEIAGRLGVAASQLANRVKAAHDIGLDVRRTAHTAG